MIYRAATVVLLTSLLSACAPGPNDVEPALQRITKGVSSYFTSEQRYSPPDGEYPWHRAGEDGSRSAAGLPVTFNEYVFPGGPEAKVIWNADGTYEGGAWGKQTARYLVFDTHPIDHTVWELTYEATGTAVYARAVVTAKLRADPAKSVTCKVDVDDTTQEMLRPPCVAVGF